MSFRSRSPSVYISVGTARPCSSAGLDAQQLLLAPVRFVVPIGKGVGGLPYTPWATATATLVVAIKGASLVVCWLPSVADAAGTEFAARSTARLAEEAEAGALTIGACGTNQYEHERVVFIPRGRHITVLGNSPEPFCGYFVGVPCKGDGACGVDEVKRAAAALQAQISREELPRVYGRYYDDLIIASSAL